MRKYTHLLKAVALYESDFIYFIKMKKNLDLSKYAHEISVRERNICYPLDILSLNILDVLHLLYGIENDKFSNKTQELPSGDNSQFYY